MGSRRIGWALLAALLLAGIAAAASHWAGRSARAATDRTAATVARTHLGLLTSELQKFRLLPLVLAEYPDVVQALGSKDKSVVMRLNRTLELLADRTDAAVLYAVDDHGLAIAASNWRLPATFVGQDYAFRRYFRDAMAHGRSEVFALGSVSGRPGLYLARRIGGAARPLGVIVVKVEFDRLERMWAQAPGATVVVDARGLILVTSRSRWRFHPTRTLAPQTISALRLSRQFGPSPPTSAAFSLDGRDAVQGKMRYRVASIAAPLADSRLLHLSPLQPQLATARMRALLAGAGLALLILLAGGLGLRGAERRRLHADAQAALEREVARRTTELRDANAQLRIESDERAAADRRFRAAREELAQANRLGSLGQITAGVAHEINQPLAAIRTFAENGETLLDRGRPEVARVNLGRIVALADRIGTITGELRNFARRRTPSRGTPTLGAALEGTLLLIGERARNIVRNDVAAVLQDSRVIGDQVRLEQILVNLLQNALDAVEGEPAPCVTIDASEGPDQRLHVRIADNGCGISASLAESLFTPFASTKAEGLGLGLAIARDIAREFGGELALETPGAGQRTVFVLTLRRAETETMA